MRISDWSSDVCSSDLFFRPSKALSHRDAEGPRLVGRKAEPRPSAALAVESEPRIFVEQIVHIDRDFELVGKLDPRAEVDQLIIGQLEVERRRRADRRAAEGEAVDEGPRIVFLVAGLGVAAADMLEGGGGRKSTRLNSSH